MCFLATLAKKAVTKPAHSNILTAPSALVVRKGGITMNLTVPLAPRMRTVAEAAKEVGLSAYTVRRLVKENKIVYVRSGAKYLVNLDLLIAYLNGQN